MKRYLLFFLIGIFLTSSVIAEKNPLFIKLNDTEDIISLKVSGIVQDKRGFVWLATQEGLYRYEGIRSRHWIKDLRDSNSLVSDMIQTIYYDEENDSLWLGTYQGISCFSIITENFTNYKYKDGIRGSLSDSVVTSIVKDNSGKLWIGTLNGLNRLDPDTGYIDQISMNSKGEGTGSIDDSRNIIRSLYYDSSDNCLWIGTIGGLFTYKAEQLQNKTADNHIPYMVMKIERHNNRQLFLGTWENGLFLYDILSNEYKYLGFDETNIYTLKKGLDNNLWVGTWNQGLYEYQISGGLVRSYTRQDENEFGLPHNIIYSLCLDNSGILWIGTNGGGAVRFDPLQENPLFLSHHPNNNSISSNSFQALFWDEDCLWLASYGDGVECYNRQTGEIKHYKSSSENGIRNNTTYAIIKDNRDRILVAHNNGVDYYNKGNDSFLPFIYSDSGIFSLYQDSRGIYWLGENKVGLIGLKENRGRLEEVCRYGITGPDAISSDIIYFSLEDNKGNIWAGTNNGLNRIDVQNDSVKIYRFDPYQAGSLIDNKTRSGFVDSQGRVFVATISGVSMYRPETDSFYNFLYNVPGENGGIFSIAEDFSGNLWFARKKSIEVYDKQLSVIDRFDKSQGINARSFDSGIARDSNGSLYFASRGKIWSLHENQQALREVYIPVYLEDFRIFNKSINFDVPVWLKEKIGLKWNDDFFQFEFSALEYGNPEGIVYYYRMDGFDKTWVYNGTSHFASYTNLRPGNYKFNVKAVSNKKNYISDPVSVEIIINPAPWFSWWAVCLYSLAVLLGLYLIITIRRNKQTRKKIRFFNTDTPKDMLTGLVNRRGLDENIKNIWHHNNIASNDLSLVMLDIDNFKDYNDYYGHLQGDSVLKEISKILNKSFSRNNDLIVRYGGEEFLVILQGIDIDTAETLLQHCYENFNHMNFVHDRNPLGYLTVSGGLVSLESSRISTFSGLINLAEEALLEAKRTGKNKYCRFPY